MHHRGTFVILFISLCLISVGKTISASAAMNGSSSSGGGGSDRVGGHGHHSGSDDSTTGTRYCRLADHHSNPKNYISQLILEMEDSILKLMEEADDYEQELEEEGEEQQGRRPKKQRRGRRRHQLTTTKLEQMAIFIYESMSISTRNYHSVQHVFDISEELDDPIAILAACFHDCIYYHVDGGLTPIQAYRLEGTYDTNDSTRRVLSGRDNKCKINHHKYTKSGIPDVHDLQRNGYTFRGSSPAILSLTETRKGKDKEESSGDNHLPRHTLLLQMVESIFGYQPNEVISVQKGLNEFLSAVIAVRQLSDLLTLEQLVQVACCIEATIPFRPIDKTTGKTHMHRLYDRMVLTAQKFKLNGLLEMEERNVDNSDDRGDLFYPRIVKCIQRACILSNSDVGNFGTTDRFWFLDNTWSLLPETNESLRNQFVYSVQQFHHAMKKMYDFFGFLQPDVVFHQFQNVPSSVEMDRLVNECRRNLQFGKTYVAAKLLAMSLVAALAVLTGGDEAPLSMFTGDLTSDHQQQPQQFPDIDENGKEEQEANSREHHEQRFSAMRDDSIPEHKPRLRQMKRASLIKHESRHEMPTPKPETLQKCTPIVYEILSEGRRSKTSFDTRKSPWAAYLYGSLGDDGLDAVLEQDKKDKDEGNPLLYPMTDNPDRAWKLLKILPLDAVKVISKDIEDAAISRADQIRQIVSKLEEEQAQKAE